MVTALNTLKKAINTKKKRNADSTVGKLYIFYQYFKRHSLSSSGSRRPVLQGLYFVTVVHAKFVVSTALKAFPHAQIAQKPRLPRPEIGT